MANYPTLSVSPDIQGTSETWRDPKKISYSRANTVKARMMSSGRKTNFMVHHNGMSGADYNTLKTFYDTNRANTFTFVWSRLIDNVLTTDSYTVIFGDNNIDNIPKGAGTFECTVQLIEV